MMRTRKGKEHDARLCAWLSALASICGGLVGLAGIFGLPVSALAQSSIGVMRVVVFAPGDGGPARGLWVHMRGQQARQSDRDGAVSFAVPAGRWKLTLWGKGYKRITTRALPVVAGETTEVLISMRERRAPKVVVEAITQSKGLKRRLGRRVGPRIRVSGAVLHARKKTPIQGAQILVRGLAKAFRSDAQGRFFLVLPAGVYDLTVIHPAFSTARRQGVRIQSPMKTLLLVKMQPAAVQLDDLVISAPRIEGSTIELLKKRQESSSVSEMLGAEEMAKTGDSSAAGALKRVSGVTLVGGKYVYVRGLGERYSSTLLNRSTLPSPEPERRVVPLDLFPTGVLEKVVLQKTFLPNMPGEFAGGSVQLFTRGFPGQFMASVGFSFGINLQSSFLQGIQYPGGPFDFLGIDGGTRALPRPILEASKNQKLAERDLFSPRGYTAAELQKFGEMMKNVWEPRRRMILPDMGISGSLGDRFKFSNGIETGYLAYFTYDNGWSKRLPISTIYTLGQGGKLEKANTYNFETVSNNIKLAGILAWGIDFSKYHKIRLNLLMNRITDNETRTYEGFNRDVATEIRVARLRWIEQMLSTQQLRGEHWLGKDHSIKLDWRYTFSIATRIEPDRREYREDLEPGTTRWLLSDRPEGNQRVFSDLSDFNHDIAFDLKIPFMAMTTKKSFLKLGATAMFKDRGVDTRRYKFLHKGAKSNDTNLLAKNPEQIFQPDNIGSDGFQLGEITRATDNYEASQRVIAAYAMVDMPLGYGFKLTGGLRLEYGSQFVKTFQLFNPDDKPVIAELQTFDPLPAVLLSWAFREGMVLRTAYSRTVSRPDFRELSPATFNDVTGGRQVFGNPDLQRATIHNLDLRWEWYPSSSESFSVGVFYKRFQQPIETIVEVSAQLSVTYGNAIGADNLGVEFDWRKNFGFLNDSLENLYFAGNLTLVWSQVELDASNGGIQTSNQRALQGQSPYVFNIQLGYDNPDTGLQMALLYNVFGARITEVGAFGAPDVFEQPFHQLDLVFRKKLGRGFRLSLKAKNLLDLPVRVTQGDFLTLTYTKGRAFSIGLSYSY